MAKKSLKDKVKVQPVVDAQIVDEAPEAVQEIVKQTSGTTLAKADEVALLNPEFEGLSGSGAPSQIKKTPVGFTVYLEETGESFDVDEINGVIVAGRVCYTVYDPKKGENGFLYKTYDKIKAVTGEDWSQIMEEAGVDKETFRYELFIQTEYSEEPLPMIGSGTAKYRLAEYARQLADQHGVGLKDVITKITIENYYNKQLRRQYPVEKFEFVKLLKEGK